MSATRTGKQVEAGSDPRPRGILLCYDASAEAKRALERVAEIAATAPSRVTVITVAEPTARTGPFTIAADPIESEAHNRLLEEALWVLSDRGIAAAVVEPTGAPAESIVDVARHIGADLVVVGSRHRGLVRRLLFGSVSADVVAEAPCDVLVVR